LQGLSSCSIATSSSQHCRVILRSFLHFNLQQADACLEDSLLQPLTSAHLLFTTSKLFFTTSIHHSTKTSNSLTHLIGHFCVSRRLSLRTSNTIMAGAVELPKEVWLEVVSYLDYFELKMIMGVSKAFKSYTELPACQKTMFRSKTVIPDGDTINLAELRLHPVFASMSYECASELEEVHLCDRDGDWMPLTDTCAAEEYATDPPLAFMRLQIFSSTPIQVTNKSGITVVQVMKSLCRFFSKNDSFDVTGGRTGWQEWDGTKLDRKGRLLLRATGFDS
jgi:hypothetical protein